MFGLAGSRREPPGHDAERSLGIKRAPPGIQFPEVCTNLGQRGPESVVLSYLSDGQGRRALACRVRSLLLIVRPCKTISTIGEGQRSSSPSVIYVAYHSLVQMAISHPPAV